LGAPGIEAEIPQDLHKQIRGIAAESPVPSAKRRDGAQISNFKWVLDRLLQGTIVFFFPYLTFST
jgi:hypothetical protein